MIEIQQTGDGSPTLYSSVYDASYHSRKGALNESRHVFVKNGIVRYLSDKSTVSDISIIEMGYGSGLNAFLTSNYALENQLNIHYTGIEKHPVPPETASSFLTSDAFKEIDIHNHYAELNEAEWNTEHDLHAYFRFRKCEGNFLTFDTETSVDILFYDAFGPKTQAELWDMAACKQMYSLLKPGGIIATYCAQGQFKRNLKKVGFKVHALDGPPGKREMTYAVKVN